MEICRTAARQHVVLLAFAALLFSASVLAAPAARVEFAAGNVTATAADGKVRPLAKGGEVAPGDTVSTNEGRAQLRFTDDGLVSLHTQSVFRIEQYQWSGATDGTERGIFRLIKGGLRTITGKLSKINRKAYLMHTAVATIGIRGTEYTMQLNGGLSGSVAEGAIEVCNSGGCLGVASGQSYYVPDAATKPALSNKQTALPPRQPDATASKDSASEVVKGLEASTVGLSSTVSTSTNDLFTLANGATTGLTGGTLSQTVQGAVGAIGGAAGGLVAGTTGAVGGVTGAVSGVTGATGGVTGALTGGIPAANGVLGTINLGL